VNHRSLLGLIVTVLAAAVPSGPAAVEDPPPHESGLVEKIGVQLVILDVLVLDRNGNPVPGLVSKDFDVEVDQRSVPLVGVDDSCTDVVQKPNIILAFDYQHLDEAQRGRILDDVRSAVDRGEGGGADVMVTALTGGLRVEQPFTMDRDRVETALTRMRNDVSLWGGNFSHKNEDGFVRGLTSLFDVAGTFPGPTAVILYSGMQAVPLEEQFRQLAAQAAAARCAVYPVSVEDLSTAPLPSQGATPRYGPERKTAPPLTLSNDEGEPATVGTPPDQPPPTSRTIPRHKPG
jgi:VWFA-related protein